MALSTRVAVTVPSKGSALRTLQRSAAAFESRRIGNARLISRTSTPSAPSA